MILITLIKRFFSVGILVALPLTLLFPSSAFASHSWVNYHWARTSNPVNLNLVRHLSKQPNIWPPGFWLAKLTWNASNKVNYTTVVGDDSSAARSACSMVAGELNVCHANYGGTGWGGLASINIDGNGHITQATAKMNDFYSWKQDSRQLVTCQEIGHTLGLDHQDTNQFNANLGTCMDYTATTLNVPNNLSANSHDYTQLNTIYAHTDTYTTAGASNFQAASVEMEGLDTSQPDEWGSLVKSSDDGKIQVFERTFSDGFKLVTFVTWASDEQLLAAEVK